MLQCSFMCCSGMQPSMIEVRNLSKTYLSHKKKVTVLKNINLNIQPNEIFSIVGRSGAGKSTLIRCINMLIRPSEGTVLVNGHCMTDMSPTALRQARKNIGMIFQDFNLLYSRNVYENIALPLELINTPKRQKAMRVEELLLLTDLHSLKNQPISQLSGGQKQRVAIARALANAPKVLLCDEVTSALDPQTTLSILSLLQTLRKELGITILLITHEMDVVKAICDRVAILHKGEIIEKSGVADLFVHPQTQVATNLVKASSRMDLPYAIQEKLLQLPHDHSGTLLRIAYHGNSASQPILSHLIKEYDVVVNILQGCMETIQEQLMGTMIVEFIGTKENIDKCILFLEKNNLNVEILGYVRRNA